METGHEARGTREGAEGGKEKKQREKESHPPTLSPTKKEEINLKSSSTNCSHPHALTTEWMKNKNEIYETGHART